MEILRISDLRRFYSVTKNIDNIEVERAIADAIDLDLSEFICDEFLVEMENGDESDWLDVLEKKVYEVDLKKFRHVGLRRALSSYAYARYLERKGGVDTPFGFVEKEVDWSKNVDKKIRMEIIKEERRKGSKLMKGVIDYLKRMNAHNFNEICKCDDDYNRSGFNFGIIEKD